MRCLLLASRSSPAVIRPSSDRLPSQPLDPRQVLQEALYLAEELATLVEQTPLLGLEPADRRQPDPETFRFGREVGDPGLEVLALGDEPSVLRTKRPDQLDRALHVLLQEPEACLDVLAHLEPLSTREP